jgi:hypothetical protein
VLLLGCGKKQESQKTGSGTGVASGSAVTQVADAAAAAATCDLAGKYRLRFRSNGADGWWLRLEIKGTTAELAQKDVMDVLAAPLTFAADGCKATITSKNEHSGDAKLEMTLDPKTNIVTGTLARTKGGEKGEADSVPVTGRRDVGPIATPACIKPGLFEIGIGSTKWKLSEGKPGRGNGGCKDFTETAKQKVRVEMLGDELFVDEVSGEKDEQSFARAKLTKKGDCAYDVELQVQDWSFTGSVTFDGDKVTGTATQSRYQVFEDGEAGENLWACEAKNAPIEGKRVGD